MTTLLELAKMIDHSLLSPTLTDADLRAGCDLARHYQTASVCIKPYAVAAASEWLAGTEVAVGTVIGFPHGSSRIETKMRETETALADGATEIDMVVNVGKVLGEEWAYVTQEIRAVNAATVGGGALLKVIFENDFLPADHYKIRLCEICSLQAVAFVKTSTGYGFVRQPDGRYAYQGATDHDLALMRQHTHPTVQVKAAGKVRTLEDLLRVRALGVTRVGATATESILQQAMRRGFPAGGATFDQTLSAPNVIPDGY